MEQKNMKDKNTKNMIIITKLLVRLYNLLGLHQFLSVCVYYKLWNRLLKECFQDPYNLNHLKSRVNLLQIFFKSVITKENKMFYFHISSYLLIHKKLT